MDHSLKRSNSMSPREQANSMSPRGEHMNIDKTDDNDSSDSSSVGTEVGSLSTPAMPPANNITFRRRWERLHTGSISNLCSATLGAGALSLPFAISLTGIVLGVLLLIFSAILTVYSIDVIIDACVRTKLFKYEDVSQRLVGRSAARLLEASILIFCFGTAVAYLCAVGDILDEGLRSIPYMWELDSDGKAGRFASIYSIDRITILFWGLVMFPLSLQRDVSGLERFSPLGVFSIIFLVIAAIVHSISHGDVKGKGENTQHPTDIGSMLWPKSSWDVVRAFPIIIFAFSCQPNVCSIYQELTPADAPCGASRDDISMIKSKQLAMRRLTRYGIILCMTLYLGIGIYGFLDFSHATLDNILNNYCIQATHDALMIAASAFVAVAIVVAFPFNILPARVTLKLILERSRRMRRWHRCQFFSNATCGDCCGSCCWLSPMLRPQYSQIESIDLDDELHADAADSLLSDERFGDRPSMVPHMSFEGSQHVEEDVNSTESPPLEHFLLTLFLSGSALIVALLIPGISVVFGLMGGTAASIISFVLPGMFLMDTNEDNGRSRQWRILPVLMVWGGTLIGVVTTFVTIYGMFIPSEGKTSNICNN